MESGTEPLGLRERKKLQTRQAIADTAMRLFLERGFEAVSISEIARAADVSDKTVFNYFPTKEDLFYSRLQTFEADLLDVLRQRGSGESYVAAFRRFLGAQRGLLAREDPQAQKELRTLIRTITSSPALLVREEQILAGYSRSLASLIARDTGARGDDVRPEVAASAMIGAHRVLIEYTRRRVLAGDDHKRIARGLRAQTEKALSLLDQGLAGLGVK
jgi:AcrR family transcriptional regulator